MSEITENVLRIKRELAKLSPGREILLVAATKMNDAGRVREAVAAGVYACGENRVQEMLEKNEQGAYEGAPLHFIGHLQKNKVKYVVGLCALIQSVSDRELAELISLRAKKLGIVQDVLLEVNIGSEPQKGGFDPGTLETELGIISGFAGIRVRGLMAIPPAACSPAENRRYFARMNELFIDIGLKKYDNICMDFLSMGMSGDYTDAVEEGANMVRVGSAIFGARDYGRNTVTLEDSNGTI